MVEKKTHTIAMSGSTGFVGSLLVKILQEQGWQIIPLGRKDFASGVEALAKKMEGSDIVINLAGAPIIKRWTNEYKQELHDSRVHVTGRLVQACAKMNSKPELFISTSAIGYYNEKGTHTEQKYVHADNFLGNLAQKWEKEALKAKDLDIRTVIFRFGVVLGKDGGALKQMLIPFKLGLGGKIGNGTQSFSWVHIKDLMRAYVTVIDSSSYSGIYNLTSPNPSTNGGLTMALGKALCRPTFFHIPHCILKLQFGEGASVLTGGQRVLPERLLHNNFKFQFPTIDEAVKDCVS